MVFILSALWWRRMRGLWKLPDERDWLRGKLGLVLMGGAMLSKSLIQFSIDGWSCVPSLLFTWGQTTLEVIKIMGSKDPMHVLLHSLPPTLHQVTTHPCLCWRLLDTPGQVWVSLQWGHCSGSWLWPISCILIPRFSLKLNKVGKTNRSFKYDLNQIPYDYTVQVRNRFKGLDLIEWLMNYGRRFMTLYRR